MAMFKIFCKKEKMSSRQIRITGEGLKSELAKIAQVSSVISIQGAATMEIKHTLRMIERSLQENISKIDGYCEKLQQIIGRYEETEQNLFAAPAEDFGGNVRVSHGNPRSGWKDRQLRPLKEALEKHAIAYPAFASTTAAVLGLEADEGTIQGLFPTKEEHYNRNKYMPLERLPISPEEAKNLGWDDGVASDCHQFTARDGQRNTKYVSPDERYEVIFDSDGNRVMSDEDYGTYNYADPNTDPLGHFCKDVIPWIIWGNSENDTTNVGDRLKAFVVDGAISAIKEKLGL